MAVDKGVAEKMCAERALLAEEKLLLYLDIARRNNHESVALNSLYRLFSDFCFGSTCPSQYEIAAALMRLLEKGFIRVVEFHVDIDEEYHGNDNCRPLGITVRIARC